MYCKYCGKNIDDDSCYCCHCGKKVTAIFNGQLSHSSEQMNEAYTIVKNGQKYTVRNGIIFDEDGWDVGIVPNGYQPGWGDPV